MITMQSTASRSKRRAIQWMGALAILLGTQIQAHAAQEVSLYTTREPKLILPLLESFTTKTGIKVNTVFVKSGLIERVKTEGEKSPADVLMAVDIGNLIDLVENSVTQPITSAVLNSAIPPHLRSEDGQWFALSLRDRVLYADKGLQVKSFTYENLADPKWKGKVCIRSGQHPYNNALIASMIAHNGLEQTEKWLRGVKANLARKPAGGDRDVARDILGGICDIGLANAYYAGQMKTSAQGTDARKWGEAITVVRPTFAKTGGTFVNISGASVAKYAPNKENAVKLLEFLVSDEAQGIYAKANFEYPVKPGAPKEATIESFGPLHVDPTPLKDVARYRKQASELVDRVRFDQ